MDRTTDHQSPEPASHRQTTAYVSWAVTLVNSALILAARVFMVATHATAIRAAIRAYSTRSCPDSSLCRFFNMLIIYRAPCVCVLLPSNRASSLSEPLGFWSQPRNHVLGSTATTAIHLPIGNGQNFQQGCFFIARLINQLQLQDAFSEGEGRGTGLSANLVSADRLQNRRL